MALSPQEVEEFMTAEKVVTGQTARGTTRIMDWQRGEPDNAIWRVPVEIQAAQVGELFLRANPNLPRHWTFKLLLRREEVIRWDVRPRPGGHNNPPGRPEGFPGKVPEPEHEHLWVEHLDLKCARPLEGLRASEHRAILETFCERTHVRFEPPYVAPQAFEQLEL